MQYDFSRDAGSSVNGEAMLLYWEDPNASELNVMKIIKFMGGTVKLVRWLQKGLTYQESFTSARGCLITSAQTLSRVSNTMQRSLGLRKVLMSMASNVLVYGFEPIPAHNLLLQELTLGGLLGVRSLRSGDHKFRVTQDSRNICRQFTGLSCGIANSESMFSFIEGKKQGAYTSLIRIEERPFFVRTKDEGLQLLLLANSQIADLDAEVPKTSSLLAFFPGLVPLMMFISSASANGLWYNDKPSACLIIDDPLLKRRYGCLEFRKLLEVMERKRFSTSIAFIPWNYRRSTRGVIDLFATYPERYSLCIHGCDHTGEEFGGSSHRLLREQAQKALDRMELHRERSGLPFDDIMVFPQGVFSTVAIEALKSCGYLAAVNSSAYTNDSGDTLTLRDLVDVAVTRFGNFPLFTRRYPRNIVELAFDLFLGKPALLVEHHSYVRNGYDALAEFIDKLNSLDKRLEWKSLGNICSCACLKRVSENGDIHVKFFANRFCLKNDSDRTQQYVLIRQQWPKDQLTGIAINGRQTDFIQEDNYVKIALSLNPGQSAEVRVQFGKVDPVCVPRRTAWMYNARVFTRRALSEFRDNYIERNRCLRRTAVWSRNLFAGGK